MVGLLGAYLGSHYKDGTDFSDTLRPIPLKLKLQIRYQAATGRLLTHVISRRRNEQPRSEELAAFIPADSLSPAFC